MFEWYISLPLYFVFAYGFFQIISDIINSYLNKRLMSLIKARNDGVKLRNDGTTIEDILDAKYWMEKFDVWDKNTINLVSRISKTESEKFKVINRFRLTSGNLLTRIPTHNRKYNVLEEKLARLEELIGKVENG